LRHNVDLEQLCGGLPVVRFDITRLQVRQGLAVDDQRVDAEMMGCKTIGIENKEIFRLDQCRRIQLDDLLAMPVANLVAL
jgi:hypothetical protein